MPRIPNRQSIGPSARVTPDSLGAIRERADLTDKMRIVLIGFGGIEGVGRPKSLPKVKTPSGWSNNLNMQTDQTLSLYQTLGCNFTRSFLTQTWSLPNQATARSLRLHAKAREFYCVRDLGWPETEFMKAWLDEVTCFASVSAAAMEAGDIADAVQKLLERYLPTSIPIPSGADEAAVIIKDLARDLSLLN